MTDRTRKENEYRSDTLETLRGGLTPARRVVIEWLYRGDMMRWNGQNDWPR